jgi:hypothetical protein
MQSVKAKATYQCCRERPRFAAPAGCWLQGQKDNGVTDKYTDTTQADDNPMHPFAKYFELSHIFFFHFPFWFLF